MDRRTFLLLLTLLLTVFGTIRSEDTFDLEEKETKNPKPILSLNAILTKNQTQALNSNVYVAQMLSFILTGTYDGQTTLDDSFDNLNLDELLDFALLFFQSAIQDDPPENVDEIFADLLRIKDLLRVNGSTGVLFGDLRPYLTYGNLKNGILLYLSLNQEAFLQRYQIYLMEEFLGALGPQCRAHSALWFNDIVQGKLWAIQMFDSIAKLPAGVLEANINWVGSFKLCTDTVNDAVDPPIKGKYCRAQIGLPVQQFAGDLPIDDSIGLTYGMCISQVCNETETAIIASNTLKLAGVFKTADVKFVDCVEKKQMNAASITYTVLLCLLIGWVLVSTIYDVADRIYEFFQHGSNEPDSLDIVSSKMDIAGENVIKPQKKVVKKKPKFGQFMINCSLYSNSEKFFRTDNGGKITCLNGIRLFSMVWIIWGHTYNYIGDTSKFFVLDNIRSLAELNEEFYAQLIINGMFGVDTFFLMSAFLLTMGFMSKLEKSNGLTLFEWIYYYVHRYWRLAPPFLITIVIYNWIMPFIGYGPLWNQSDFPSNNEDCHKYWWAYVIFMNNFIPDGKGTQCMGYLWYIPNDYQFYAVSPIFMIVLYKFPKAGKALLSFTLLASLSILAFLSANVYVSRKKDIVMVLFDIWEDVYIKPYCRASPWIVGIFLGYIFFKNNRKININYYLVALGWFMSTCLALSAIFGGYTNHAKDARRMATVEFAIFFSLTRLTWPIAIGWIIFACHYGYGGFINSFLSSKAFLPLTRLSYCAYLIHPVLMVTYNYLQETLFHATGPTLLYIAIGHITMTFFVAYFYTLFFEMPFIALEKLVYSPSKSKH